MNITLHIERLALEGLPVTGSQRRVLQAAVELELTELLRGGQLSPAFRLGAALPGLRAGGIRLDAGKDPLVLGKQIAHAVYASLGIARGKKRNPRPEISRKPR